MSFSAWVRMGLSVWPGFAVISEYPAAIGVGSSAIMRVDAFAVIDVYTRNEYR